LDFAVFSEFMYCQMFWYWQGVVVAAGRANAAVGFFPQRAEHVARFERQYLHDLLARHGGDVSAAARDARLPRGTLYRLMKTHALDGAAFRK